MKTEQVTEGPLTLGDDLAEGTVPPRYAAEADRAILRTVTYAGLFQSPLTPGELHRSLMDVRLAMSDLMRRVSEPFLRARIAVTGGWVHPKGNPDWLDLKRARQGRTRDILARHRRVLRLLTSFPFVRLVALSGGCAHDNASDDDVDIFLVVRRGRAWASCLCLMVLAKALGVRRTLCLNYIVDEEGMAIPERDLFTASEIVGMRPLAGRSTYRRFIESNDWVARLFPNFFDRYVGDSEAVPEAGSPPWFERLLDLGPAPLLESAARRALAAYLRRKANGAPGVVLARHRLKLHLQDHGPRLRDAFEAAVCGVASSQGG